MLGQIETGKSLDALKLKINQIKRDLSHLEKSNQPMPELINSTNLLRTNEILSKTSEKKTELLNAYEAYFKDLERVLKKIQTGLSTLKTGSKKKIRKKTKRKSTINRKKTRPRKKPRKRKSAKRRR